MNSFGFNESMLTAETTLHSIDISKDLRDQVSSPLLWLRLLACLLELTTDERLEIRHGNLQICLIDKDC